MSRRLPPRWTRQPLDSGEELLRFESEIERRQRRWRRRVLVVGGVFFAIGLIGWLGSLSDPGGDPSALGVPLLLLSIAVIVLTPSTVRTWISLPRLAAAQRQILRTRHLLPEGDMERLAVELETLAARFEGSEAGEALVQKAGKRAADLLAELSGLEGRQADLPEVTARRATVEGLVHALAGAELGRFLAAAPPPEDGSEILTRIGEALGVERPVASAEPARDRPPASVAVLPFADLSPGGGQEIFCRGLVEDVINALSQLRDLRVIARSSAFRFTGDEQDLREVGEALGVEAAVQGSVQTSGGRVRVTVRLVRCADGETLFSERYERRLEDLFAVHDEITRALERRLRGEAPPRETPRRRRTVDLEAYQDYVRGRHLWSQRTPAALAESLRWFERAVEKAPDFALAQAGMADSYNLLGYYSVWTPADAFEPALRHARQGLRLDPDLGEAHASLAFAQLLYEWSPPRAEESFRRSLELSPSYATARHWYAELLTLGRRYDEALEQARGALDLDPLAPILQVLLGWVFYYWGRYDEAVRSLEQTLEQTPDFAPAELWLGLAHEERGETEAALEALSRAVEHSASSSLSLAALGRLRASCGEVSEAEAILSELDRRSETGYVPAYYRAGLLLGLGRIGAAFEELDRAFDQRESWLLFLPVDPTWKELADDPHLKSLEKMVTGYNSFL